MDGHEQSDVVEYCHQFLGKIKAIKPYLVEFEENSSMKSKVYLEDYAVGGSNCRPIIIITYNESIFNANNGRRQI